MTIVVRDDGKKMWAYKAAYTFKNSARRNQRDGFRTARGTSPNRDRLKSPRRIRLQAKRLSIALPVGEGSGDTVRRQWTPVRIQASKHRSCILNRSRPWPDQDNARLTAADARPGFRLGCAILFPSGAFNHVDGLDRYRRYRDSHSSLFRVCLSGRAQPARRSGLADTMCSSSSATI